MSEESLNINQMLAMAFHLGQLYWEQADSELCSQHEKSKDTLKQYHELEMQALAMSVVIDAAVQSSVAIINIIDDKAVRNKAANIADTLIGLTDVKDL